jgi:hypothetical protein
MVARGEGEGTGSARRDEPLRGIQLVLASIAVFSVSDALAKWLAETLPAVEIAWLR